MITLCGFGVSNYYNKLKLIMLEKDISFEEKLVYPWQQELLGQSSPLGKIPYIETGNGSLSESQVILDYLEDLYPELPMFPLDLFQRAKCRELIQHLELNCEWVARRLYKESFFGGSVSNETKLDVKYRLTKGLEAVTKISKFSPYILGATFTAADCVAFVHFTMIQLATKKIYNENILEQVLPDISSYMQLMESRPHVQTIMQDRLNAIKAFVRLKVKYDG
ncbi:glutathione S-transferase [Methylotenera sp.]|uniref:glutathione S-transferase n=1 Tax=Methylotenera sp. TaxID=2051956 RepID=UPI002489404A|nr:glutathione S-transferase [Methylotenera sp.]MDI1360509.1 glutathione S-transferase [Methylotenera sp.]